MSEPQVFICTKCKKEIERKPRGRPRFVEDKQAAKKEYNKRYHDKVRRRKKEEKEKAQGDT